MQIDRVAEKGIDFEVFYSEHEREYGECERVCTLCGKEINYEESVIEQHLMHKSENIIDSWFADLNTYFCSNCFDLLGKEIGLKDE